MDDYVQRIGKEAIIACTTLAFVWKSEPKSMKTLNQDTHCFSQIQSRYFMNISQTHYCCSNPFSREFLTGKIQLLYMDFILPDTEIFFARW
jgi:hypothetical protein